MKSITCVVFKAEVRISDLNLVVLWQVFAGLDHLDRVPPVLVHRGPRPVHLEVEVEVDLDLSRYLAPQCWVRRSISWCMYHCC